MNYNLFTYAIYLPIIGFVMVRIGWLFYTNGELFLMRLFDDVELVRSINNLLLIGYYLVNIGYAIFSLAYWEKLNSLLASINSITHHLGLIITVLALLHYNNVFVLTHLVKSKSLKS